MDARGLQSNSKIVLVTLIVTCMPVSWASERTGAWGHCSWASLLEAAGMRASWPVESKKASWVLGKRASWPHRMALEDRKK